MITLSNKSYTRLLELEEYILSFPEGSADYVPLKTGMTDPRLKRLFNFVNDEGGFLYVDLLYLRPEVQERLRSFGWKHSWQSSRKLQSVLQNESNEGHEVSDTFLYMVQESLRESVWVNPGRAHSEIKALLEDSHRRRITAGISRPTLANRRLISLSQGKSDTESSERYFRGVVYDRMDRFQRRDARLISEISFDSQILLAAGARRFGEGPSHGEVLNPFVGVTERTIKAYFQFRTFFRGPKLTPSEAQTFEYLARFHPDEKIRYIVLSYVLSVPGEKVNPDIPVAAPRVEGNYDDAILLSRTLKEHELWSRATDYRSGKSFPDLHYSRTDHWFKRGLALRELLGKVSDGTIVLTPTQIDRIRTIQQTETVPACIWLSQKILKEVEPK